MMPNSLANHIYQLNKANQDEIKESLKGLVPVLQTVRQSEKERERIAQEVNSTNALATNIGYQGPALEIDPKTGKPPIDPNTYLNIAKNTAETEADKQILIAKYGKEYAPMLANVNNPYALKTAEAHIAKQRETDLFIQSATEYGYTPDKLGYKEDWSDLDVEKGKIKLASIEKNYNLTKPLSAITHGQGKKARQEFDTWLKNNPKATYIEQATKRDEIQQIYEDKASEIAKYSSTTSTGGIIPKGANAGFLVVQNKEGVNETYPTRLNGKNRLIKYKNNWIDVNAMPAGYQLVDFKTDIKKDEFDGTFPDAPKYKYDEKGYLINITTGDHVGATVGGKTYQDKKLKNKTFASIDEALSASDTLKNTKRPTTQNNIPKQPGIWKVDANGKWIQE